MKRMSELNLLDLGSRTRKNSLSFTLMLCCCRLSSKSSSTSLIDFNSFLTLSSHLWYVVKGASKGYSLYLYGIGNYLEVSPSGFSNPSILKISLFDDPSLKVKE